MFDTPAKNNIIKNKIESKNIQDIMERNKIMIPTNMLLK